MRIKKFHRKLSYSMNSAYPHTRIWINLINIHILVHTKEQPDTSESYLVLIFIH